jgi:hypothetical protein
MSDPSTTRPPGSEDPRVQHAREVLRYFDGGNWADAGSLTVQMAGHLADAVRMLLEVISERAGGPSA